MYKCQNLFVSLCRVYNAIEIRFCQGMPEILKKVLLTIFTLDRPTLENKAIAHILHNR